MPEMCRELPTQLLIFTLVLVIPAFTIATTTLYFGYYLPGYMMDLSLRETEVQILSHRYTQMMCG